MKGSNMHPVFLKSVAFFAAIAACACGGDGAGPSSPSAPSAATPVTITIAGQNGALSFTPNPASAGGRSVVFKNNDSIVHRIALNDGSLETENIAPGATSRTLMMPGNGTNYHCTIHPAMIGSVSASSGGPPPACEGAYCGGGY
jgi:plastocyanin